MDWLTGGNRHDKATEQIYEVAAQLAAVDGLDRLSIDAIAGRAGCSKATVYRHTGGKIAIRDGLLIRAMARVLNSVREQVRSMTGKERVVAAILLSVRAVRSDPVFSSMTRRTPAARVLEQKILNSPALPATAAELAGLPSDDPLAAQWLVQLMVALLFFPTSDPVAEEAIVHRFVAPGLVATGFAATDLTTADGHTVDGVVRELPTPALTP